MKRIYFKRTFAQAVLSGRKTTTLRRWARAGVYPGQTVFSPGIGVLTITACERVEFSELRRADARADGFDSMAKLLAAVRKIYPEYKTDGKQWYRVKFQLGGKGESPAMAGDVLPGAPAEARLRLATLVRAELDKAVLRNGSLATL